MIRRGKLAKGSEIHEKCGLVRVNRNERAQAPLYREGMEAIETRRNRLFVEAELCSRSIRTIRHQEPRVS